MKYLLHDTAAMDDEKLAEVFIKFGYEGTGLFWAVLEKIAKQEKPIKTDVLKSQLKVGKKLNKCWLFLEEIGIIQSNNGETFNENILKFGEKYQIKKEKTRERVSQWRENQKNAEFVTSYEHVSNAPKVNESKLKETGTDAPTENSGIDKKKVREYLWFAGLRDGVDDEVIRLMNYYAGQPINDLKSVCNKWVSNMRNGDIMPAPMTDDEELAEQRRRVLL